MLRLHCGVRRARTAGLSPAPHMFRSWAHLCDSCTGTGLAPATSAPGPGAPPATSAPGPPGPTCCACKREKAEREFSKSQLRKPPGESGPVPMLHATCNMRRTISSVRQHAACSVQLAAHNAPHCHIPARRPLSSPPQPEQKCILCATGKEPPAEAGAPTGPSVPLSFANDGSFLKQFQKTQKPASVLGSVCMCFSRGLPFCQCKCS
jgi:hypothetical protein